VTPIEAVEDLAIKLTQHTWTCCTAFELCGYVLVNDSTSADGAQEYAVLMRLADGTWRQIESITFGWCTTEKAADLLRRIIAGEFDDADYAVPVEPRLETPAEHGSCHLCA
jgi:hypothetical protein